MYFRSVGELKTVMTLVDNGACVGGRAGMLVD